MFSYFVGLIYYYALDFTVFCCTCLRSEVKWRIIGGIMPLDFLCTGWSLSRLTPILNHRTWRNCFHNLKRRSSLSLIHDFLFIFRSVREIINVTCRRLSALLPSRWLLIYKMFLHFSPDVCMAVNELLRILPRSSLLVIVLARLFFVPSQFRIWLAVHYARDEEDRNLLENQMLAAP